MSNIDMFEGLPDYAVKFLQDQCRLYLTVPGVKEYIEQTYSEMLQNGFSKTEAQESVKRVVETKTLAFIGEMNRAEERARKENQGIRRIRNILRDWLVKAWQTLVLEFRIHFC